MAAALFPGKGPWHIQACVGLLWWGWWPTRLCHCTRTGHEDCLHSQVCPSVHLTAFFHCWLCVCPCVCLCLFVRFPWCLFSVLSRTWRHVYLTVNGQFVCLYLHVLKRLWRDLAKGLCEHITGMQTPDTYWWLWACVLNVTDVLVINYALWFRCLAVENRWLLECSVPTYVLHTLIYFVPLCQSDSLSSSSYIYIY